jgi:hypothetical protein
MSVLFLRAAAARSSSRVSVPQPAASRAAFTRSRTAPFSERVRVGEEDATASAAGAGSEAEDGGTDADPDGDTDVGDPDEDVDEDDVVDDGAPAAEEPTAEGSVDDGEDARAVPAGPAVFTEGAAPAERTTREGLARVRPATVERPVDVAPATEAGARRCAVRAASGAGAPSTPSRTGETPFAEFEAEESSDTGALSSDSTGTARAITPAAMPTTNTGTARRGRKEKTEPDASAHRRIAERIRTDAGGPGGNWCIGVCSEAVKSAVVTLARLAVCKA